MIGLLLLLSMASAGESYTWGQLDMHAAVVNPEADHELNAYEPPAIPWARLSVPANAAETIRQDALQAYRGTEQALGLPESPAAVRVDCTRATCTATVAPQLSPGDLVALRPTEDVDQ